MKTQLIQRAASLALATLLTVGVFGVIDHLAGAESASAQWAAAVQSPRA